MKRHSSSMKRCCRESQTIKHMIEDDCADNEIPLLNVTSVTEKDESLKSWDAESVKADQITLFENTLAANYLHISRDQITLFRDIKGLLDLTCQTVANMIKWKTKNQRLQLLKAYLI
uniref:Uncharacterized protein n=1 Tax=Salix viminalis TaxID=40686 RepID=A0A6N2LZ25_SALVM